MIWEIKSKELIIGLDSDHRQKMKDKEYKTKMQEIWIS